MADQIKYSVDDRKLRQAMLKFAIEKKKSFSDTLIQGSRILAENLAFQTQPYGFDRAARQAGETAVATEIQYVYKSVPYTSDQIKTSGKGQGKKRTQNTSQAAGAFVQMVKRGQLQKAQELLHRLHIHPFFSTEVKQFDQGHEHEKSRFGARKKVSRNTFPRLIPPSIPHLRSYIKKIQDRVGMAKGGWASCSQQLGGFGKIPAWVSRHALGAGLGSVDDASFLETRPYIRLTNNVPWVDKCLSPTQMQKAFDIASYKMMQFLRHSMAKAVRSSGFNL